MTSVYLLGHGGYWQGANDAGADGMYTYVPPGMTVHFYSLENQGLLSVNAVQILTGGLQADLGSAASSALIPNYCFSPLEIVPWRRIFALIPDNRMPNDVRFIGDSELQGVDRLCLNSGYCTPQGHHATCFGLFQKLRGVTDLHLLSCRIGPLAPGTDIAAEAAKYPSTEHIPGETPDNPAYYHGVLKRIEVLLAGVGWDDASSTFKDAENADTVSAFDALDVVEQVKLLTADPVWTWWRLREAREELATHRSKPDLSEFIAWLKSERDADEINLYRKDAVLGSVITDAGI